MSTDSTNPRTPVRWPLVVSRDAYPNAEFATVSRGFDVCDVVGIFMVAWGRMNRHWTYSLLAICAVVVVPSCSNSGGASRTTPTQSHLAIDGALHGERLSQLTKLVDGAVYATAPDGVTIRREFAGNNDCFDENQRMIPNQRTGRLGVQVVFGKRGEQPDACRVC